MKKLLLLLLVVLFMGCAFMKEGAPPINFHDGSWSSCTYSKLDGTSWTIPLQLGGVPLGGTQSDGTRVECVPITREEKV